MRWRAAGRDEIDAARRGRAEHVLDLAEKSAGWRLPRYARIDGCARADRFHRGVLTRPSAQAEGPHALSFALTEIDRTLSDLRQTVVRFGNEAALRGKHRKGSAGPAAGIRAVVAAILHVGVNGLWRMPGVGIKAGIRTLLSWSRTDRGYNSSPFARGRERHGC